MKDKDIQKIANKIIELEKKANLNTINQDYIFQEMEKLLSDYDLSDLLEIDEYIQENNLLTF